MANGIATSLLNALGSICGVPQSLAAGSNVASNGIAGPVLGNILVAGAAGVVTLLCFVVALWMLIKPGERNPNHPKYRILSPDR